MESDFLFKHVRIACSRPGHSLCDHEFGIGFGSFIDFSKSSKSFDEFGSLSKLPLISKVFSDIGLDSYLSLWTPHEG